MASPCDSTLLQKNLLDNLNRVWNKDPRQRFVLRIAYAGTAGKFSIRNGEFISKGTSDPTQNVRIDLLPLTVAQFQAALAASPGWSVVTPANSQDEALNALMLLDVDDQDLFESAALGHAGDIFSHSTTLWDLTKSWGRQLKIVCDDMDSAIAQMNFLTSEKPWVDFWGKDFYNTDRLSGESDANYASRTICEIVALKVNNFAIQALLAKIFNIPVGSVCVDDDPLFLMGDWAHSKMFGPTAPDDFWSEIIEPCEVNHRRMYKAHISGGNVQYGCFIVWILADPVFYDSVQIEALIRRVKAAGVCFTLIFQVVTEEEHLHAFFLEEVVDSEPIEEGAFYERAWFHMLNSSGSSGGSVMSTFDHVMIYVHATEEVV